MCGQESRIVLHLHKMLQLEPMLTAWDFDSSTLAYQITMIDRDLFLKVRVNLVKPKISFSIQNSHLEGPVFLI